MRRFISFCLLSFICSSYSGLRQKVLNKNIEQMRLKVSLSPSTLSEKVENRVKIIVHNLSKKAGIVDPEVYISTMFDDNACVVGDKDASIMVIGQKLVEKLSEKELEGVLGHEVGHLKEDHNYRFWKVLTTNLIIQLTLSCYVTYKIHKKASLLQRSNPRFLGDTFELVFLGLSVPSGLITKFLSRRQEFEADELSVKLSGHKQLIPALEKIEPKNEASSKWDRFVGWVDKFFATHPSFEARKKHIEKLALAY